MTITHSSGCFGHNTDQHMVIAALITTTHSAYSYVVVVIGTTITYRRWKQQMVELLVTRTIPQSSSTPLLCSCRRQCHRYHALLAASCHQSSTTHLLTHFCSCERREDQNSRSGEWSESGGLSGDHMHPRRVRHKKYFKWTGV